MQGIVLNVDNDAYLMLGDDGVRYAFTMHEWGNRDALAEIGLRVDFETMGTEAVRVLHCPGCDSGSQSKPIVDCDRRRGRIIGGRCLVASSTSMSRKTCGECFWVLGFVAGCHWRVHARQDRHILRAGRQG